MKSRTVLRVFLFVVGFAVLGMAVGLAAYWVTYDQPSIALFETTPPQGAEQPTDDLIAPTASQPQEQKSEPQTDSASIRAVEVRMEEISDATRGLATWTEQGINTLVLVMPAPVTIDVEQRDPDMIVEFAASMAAAAKAAGLRFAVTVDIPIVGGVDRLAYDDLMPELGTYVETYARFAEKEDAVFFQVANEVNNLFGPQGSTQDIQRAVEELLNDAQKHFSGTVGIGVDMCRQASLSQCRIDQFDFDFSGYGMLSTSVYLSEQFERITDPVAQYLPYERAMLDRLKVIAARDGVPFILLPVRPGDIWKKGAGDCADYLCYPLSDAQEEDFYTRMFETFADETNGWFVRLPATKIFSVSGR